MLLSLFQDPIQVSENSWGPVSLPNASKPSPLDATEFVNKLKEKLGARDLSQEDYVHYYQRHVEDSFSLDEIVGLIARDKTFSPLTQSNTYPPVRLADLGTSIQDQEFQLAFKQKTKSGYKEHQFKRRSQLRRTALKRGAGKDFDKERKIVPDKSKGGPQRKFLERRTWGNKSSFYNKPHTSSVEIKSSWESKGAFPFAKLQKEDYKDSIKSEVLLESGYVHFFNPEMSQLSTRKSKKLVTPKEPKYTYYSVKTMEDKHLQQFAEESDAPTTVVITDRILSLLMASTRSVLSWDIVVVKKDGVLYFDKRNNKQRVDIISVDETSRNPPEVTEDTNNINSEYNLSMEATRINLQFQRFAVKEPKNPESGPGVLNLDDSQPHPFKKDDQIPAPVGFTYKKFHLNEFDVICRCEIDAAVGDENDYRFVTVRALNEWKPKSHEDWRSLLDGSEGRVLTTEIKNNACKFARWVSQATLAGTEEIKIGYVSRVDPNKKSPHVVLGVGSYLISQLTQQIGLTKRNMWGIFNTIVSELMKVEDGKYTLVKLPNRQTIQLYRISSSVTGSLVFRRNDFGTYQFLVLKSGDNYVLPYSKTEHGEDAFKTTRRYLKRDLGLSEADVEFSDFKYSSQIEDPETYEERSEVMHACLLKDPSFELVLSENYGDFVWSTFESANLDESSKSILDAFQKYAEGKGGIEKCF